MNSDNTPETISSTPPATSSGFHDISALLPLFDDFLLFLKTNRYSQETVYNYERDLLTFAFFLSDTHTPFEHLDKKILSYYKAYLISVDRVTALERLKGTEELSSTSINRMLSVIRSYLTYLIDMDHPVPVAPEAVQLVKTIRTHPKIAELSELVRLIEAPSRIEKDSRVGLRNRAMLELLFATGMRISELVTLKREQIDDSGKIFILGKGKKERFVYLTKRAKYHLDAYTNIRHDRFPALFIPYRGRGLISVRQRISTNYLQERIKQYRQILHINVPISAHSLRHGFATYLAEGGANPAAIQILLGHESLDTTTRYVHTSDKYAQETHQKFHPLQDIR
ncbi:MAG: tyrosine-type recombinase/integrase [Candidatus Gottesmanbacteria bacterium]|nr:tyrosine-type recombinase/integrase [Candidatus Gottesmanbacteria bacterium]